MSPRQVPERLEDFEDFADEWGDGETIQRIRRRKRSSQERDPRRDGKRKRDRMRRREPPLHKRDEE